MSVWHRASTAFRWKKHRSATSGALTTSRAPATRRHGNLVNAPVLAGDDRDVYAEGHDVNPLDVNPFDDDPFNEDPFDELYDIGAARGGDSNDIDLLADKCETRSAMYASEQDPTAGSMSSYVTPSAGGSSLTSVRLREQRELALQREHATREQSRAKIAQQRVDLQRYSVTKAIIESQVSRSWMSRMAGMGSVDYMRKYAVYNAALHAKEGPVDDEMYERCASDAELLRRLDFKTFSFAYTGGVLHVHLKKPHRAVDSKRVLLQREAMQFLMLDDIIAMLTGPYDVYGANAAAHFVEWAAGIIGGCSEERRKSVWTAVWRQLMVIRRGAEYYVGDTRLQDHCVCVRSAASAMRAKLRSLHASVSSVDYLQRTSDAIWG